MTSKSFYLFQSAVPTDLVYLQTEQNNNSKRFLCRTCAACVIDRVPILNAAICGCTKQTTWFMVTIQWIWRVSKFLQFTHSQKLCHTPCFLDTRWKRNNDLQKLNELVIHWITLILLNKSFFSAKVSLFSYKSCLFVIKYHITKVWT